MCFYILLKIIQNNITQTQFVTLLYFCINTLNKKNKKFLASGQLLNII